VRQIVAVLDDPVGEEAVEAANPLQSAAKRLIGIGVSDEHVAAQDDADDLPGADSARAD